jgi:arylsulfatase A-like enzyme
VRAGVFAGFASGVALHLILVVSSGHLFASARDYIVPPLLYAAHLTVTLGAFGLAAGVFWGVLSAARGRRVSPGERDSRCVATCIPGAVGFFALLWIGIGVYPDLDAATWAACAGVCVICLALLLFLSRRVFSGLMRSLLPPTAPAAALLVIVAVTCVLAPRLSPKHMCRRPAQTIRQLAAGHDPGRSAGMMNVLLITVDTLRADHLGCYGYSRNTSPAVDSLATEGVLVSKAYAQRPKTSPNFATILTGTYPQRHGVRGVRQILPSPAYTLAEALRDLDYTTCGVVTNGNLFPAFKFDQGFDEYFYGHSIAGEGTRLAQQWLRGRKGAPFFLWVHHTDPHTPYTPPPPYDRIFVEEGGNAAPLKKIKRRALGGVLPNKIVDGPLDLDYYVAQYDGEIAYTDRCIGELLSTVRQLGLADSTLVVFASDHGESLGDHDYYFQHGLFVYEPSARIPLIFCVPGALPPSRRVEQIFESVDIMPTILDLLGARGTGTCQGRSRADLLEGEEDPGGAAKERAYIEAGYSHHYGPGLTFALVKGRYKFVARDCSWVIRPRNIDEFIKSLIAVIEAGADSNELYDIENDPEEKNNLIESHSAVAAALETELATLMTRLEGDGRLPKDQESQTLDEQTLKSLKALGYIQ